MKSNKKKTKKYMEQCNNKHKNKVKFLKKKSKIEQELI